MNSQPSSERCLILREANIYKCESTHMPTAACLPPPGSQQISYSAENFN